MSTSHLVFTAFLMLANSWACDKRNEVEEFQMMKQNSINHHVHAYGYTPARWNAVDYYQSESTGLPTASFTGHSNQYEGRTLNKQQHVVKSLKSTKNDFQPEGRVALGGWGANLINAGFFNNRFTPANTWRPLASLANRIPVSFNPNFDSVFDLFETCTSPNGDAGICAPGSVCSLFGGRPSSPCIFGKVCCINTINKCGGIITLNNTYWQNPSTPISAPSSCSLTVRTDTKLAEQSKKAICQIRLDFISFNIAQPTAGNCIDTFQSGEAVTMAPTICGDNSGQHMYLDVPSSAVTPSNVQFTFTFAAEPASRLWNIRIALLPCGASYLAPMDCLQYFTATTGKVRSFNWLDVPSTSTIRQLNNQNYNICFRTELVSRLKATEMCLSVCPVKNGDAFSITTPTSTSAAVAADAVIAAEAALTAALAVQAVAAAVFLAAGGAVTAAQIQTLTEANVAVRDSQEALTSAQAASAAATADAALLSGVGTSTLMNSINTASCLYDFLLIAGARDVNYVEADRYCGNALNPAIIPASTSIQVCTPIRPFRITYRTDGTEDAVPAGINALPAQADTANTGFCLNYEEK